MPVKLLIVDDYEVVRRGLASLLRDDRLSIVGEAATSPETLTLAKQLKPDIVLLDIRLGPDDGLDTLAQLRSELPESKVIILSTYENPTYIARANALGAADYMLKGSTRDKMLQVIIDVAEGRAPSPHGELHRVATQMATRKKDPASELTLTQRETQVLRHLALGLSNKEISRSLSISVETVKEHVQHLLRKMDVSDRTQAAVWAVKHGLV